MKKQPRGRSVSKTPYNHRLEQAVAKTAHKIEKELNARGWRCVVTYTLEDKVNFDRYYFTLATTPTFITTFLNNLLNVVQDLELPPKQVPPQVWDDYAVIPIKKTVIAVDFDRSKF